MADSTAKTYVVNHTMISGGYTAGELITPTLAMFTQADGTTRQGLCVPNKGTGLPQELDIARLTRLYAIREATDEDEPTDGLPPDGVLLGNAPEGQTRVSIDTFAEVDPNQSTGGNQSEVGRRGKKNAPDNLPAGLSQADPNAPDEPPTGVV